MSYGCNYPLRGGKGSLYQGGALGIGSIYGPIINSRGLNAKESSMLLHAMDWLPTIVQGIANATLPSDISLDGSDFWSILGTSNELETWNRTDLFLEIQVENNMR